MWDKFIRCLPGLIFSESKIIIISLYLILACKKDLVIISDDGFGLRVTSYTKKVVRPTLDITNVGQNRRKTWQIVHMKNNRHTKTADITNAWHIE